MPVTPSPPPPTVANPTVAPPTATPRPAPSEDRVGFPEGYRDDFFLFYVFERMDNKQVRVICGNEAATQVIQDDKSGFPYGSILVMETWRAAVDGSGALVRDESGHLVRATLSGVFVMRKEPGFGEAYEGLRTGEWEYVAYRPEGETFIGPERSANCASCHVGATDEHDWTFRTELFFTDDRHDFSQVPGENEIVMTSMRFSSSSLTIKPGTRVTWINADVVAHTVNSDDDSVRSGELDPARASALHLKKKENMNLPTTAPFMKSRCTAKSLFPTINRMGGRD